MGSDLELLLSTTNNIAIDRELGSRSLYEFLQMAWDTVEPAKSFIPAWHIEAIAEHLEAAMKGQLPRLIINVPPGSTKSLSCCVNLPAWDWINHPERKFIFGSYSDRISLRDARRTRALFQSEWYQDRWADKFSLDQQTLEKVTNDKGGFRLATTIQGGVTGEHADVQLVDDPIKPLEVTGSMHVASTTLAKVLSWWNETMSSRLVDFENSVRIIIMQRLHEADLAGVMAKELEYEHLMLPMEFEPKRKCFTSIGFEDPRKEEGELLAPARFSAKAVKSLKKDLGSRGAQAQLQQNPTPAEGAIIKAAWFQFYIVAPRRFSTIIQSWDCTFKDTDGTDFVVGQIWGLLNADYYLLDQIRERMSFTDTVKAIKKMSNKWPKARAKVVEDKANGPAVVDALKRTISGLKLVNPEGGKVARCNAVEPLWEAGNVYVPHKDLCPWVGNFEEEVTGFPSRAHDDQVDAMTQALLFLEKKNISKLKEAMEKQMGKKYA